MHAVILLALLGFAHAVPSTRIVGGSDATVQSYPYMANMEYGVFGTWFSQACGGAVLTNDAILSAAQCYVGEDPTWWRVRLGSSLRTSGGTVYNVARIITHEQYSNPTLSNDIAIVRLNGFAIFSDTIGPARIAGSGFVLGDGTSLTTIGFGHLEFQGSPSEQLQHVQLNIINQNVCAQRYAHLQTLPGYSGWPSITSDMICAGILDVGNRDVCQGDSGGPLSFLSNEGDIVVGITSWRYRCGDPTYPSVFARVSSYTNWILTNAS